MYCLPAPRPHAQAEAQVQLPIQRAVNAVLIWLLNCATEDVFRREREQLNLTIDAIEEAKHIIATHGYVLHAELDGQHFPAGGSGQVSSTEHGGGEEDRLGRTRRPS